MRFSGIFLSFAILSIFVFNGVVFTCGNMENMPGKRSCHAAATAGVEKQDCCRGHLADNLWAKNNASPYADHFDFDKVCAHVVYNFDLPDSPYCPYHSGNYSSGPPGGQCPQVDTTVLRE